MPNQPKTPVRSVRVPDGLWGAAKTKAAERGETVTDAVVRALNEYTSDEESRPAMPDTLTRCALCDGALTWDEDDAAWVDAEGNLRCRPWDADGSRHQVKQS